MPKISICMATFDDFSGTFFSVQSLRMHHDLTDCEIVILDNNPKGPHGQDLRNFVNNSQNASVPIRYHEFADSVGTSATRHKLFDLAEGQLVIVMDCHVLLKAGAIAQMKKFWESADADMKKNLFTGPLLMDCMQHHQTHFECKWRAEMWGQWATAWRKEGKYWVAQEDETKTKVQMRELLTDKIGFEFKHTWSGHEHAAKKLGFELAGWGDDNDIFEVPAQGLGLFIAAKEHWLGFNPHHRHFGGEECYIHEKYRQAGRKTYCLPWMAWNHRFGRPEGPKYPITREGKMRNYVLEFQELGLDVEPIRQHFIDEIKLKPELWDKLIADPINFDPYSGWAANTAPETMKPVLQSNFGMPLPLNIDDLNSMAVEISSHKRDLESHFQKFYEYGGLCSSALEISKRRETTMWLAAALVQGAKRCDRTKCDKEKCDKACRMPRLVSYQAERDTLLQLIEEAVEGKLQYTDIENPVGNPTPVVEGSFDCLYIHHRHTFADLSAQLAEYGPRINKYIMLNGTSGSGGSGIKGEDGKTPSMLHAIKMFVKTNPEWFVVYHTEAQYGMTILSKVQEDRGTVMTPWPMTDDEGRPCGSGAELKKILKMIGIESTPDCSCNRYAAKMDADGPDLCEENIESTLDWLKEQAESRGLGALFVRPFVKMAVMRAIKKARKKIASGECG